MLFNNEYFGRVNYKNFDRFWVIDVGLGVDFDGVLDDIY